MSNLYTNEKEFLNSIKLYALNPVVLGGKDRESIISYMTRLANAHMLSLGVLTKKILTPVINQTSGRYKSYIYQNSHHVNGHGELVTLTLKTLEKLTGVKNLSKLTLIDFSEVISNINLIKKEKAWCPVCLEEMRDKSIPIYEKLIWSIREYTYCSEHSVMLTDQCKWCKKKQLYLHSIEMNGYCQHCYKWMGEYNSSSVIKHYPFDEIVYKSIQIENLFETSCNYNEIVKKDKLISSLKYIDSNLIFKTRFLQRLEIPHSSFNRYCKGIIAPPLKKLLVIGKNTNLSLTDLINNNIKDMEIKDNNPAKYSKFTKQNYKFDNEKVKEFLEIVLASSRLISLDSIATDLKVSIVTINKYFPELVSAIREKNSSLYNSNSCMNYNNKRDYEYIKSKTSELLNRNEVIPIMSLCRELNISNSTLRKRFPDEIKKIKKKNQLLLSLKQENKEVLKDLPKRTKVLKYIDSITVKPKKIVDIEKELGISRYKFIKHFPDLYQLIMNKNKEIEKEQSRKLCMERKEELIETILKIYQSGNYPSFRLVKREMKYDFSYRKEFIHLWRKVLVELGINQKLR